MSYYYYYCQCQIPDYYLHNAVGPTLPHTVSCPHIVPILRQLLHKLVLVGGQFHMAEIQRSWLVPTAHHIAETEKEATKGP